MDKIALLDIVAPLAPPPAPPPYGWIALGVGTSILLIGGLLYLAWRRRRVQRTALAQLKRTAYALRNQRIDARTAAFQIGYTVRRISRNTKKYSVSLDWTDFSRALDQARFAPRTPSADTSAKLLERARNLLRTLC